MLNLVHIGLIFWEKEKSLELSRLLTGEEGFEPPWTVLETGILPLDDSPTLVSHSTDKWNYIKCFDVWQENF